MLYAGSCLSGEEERETPKKALTTPPEEAGAEDEAAQDEAAQDNKQPTKTQQPVQKPPVTLVSATDANEPVVEEEKFKNERLVLQLYEAVTDRYGKYGMVHFSAHLAELGFASTSDNDKPSYGKTKEFEAFEKAGSKTKASSS